MANHAQTSARNRLVNHLDIKSVIYAHEGQPQEINIKTLNSQRKLSLERFFASLEKEIDL
jgi:hypothetical protein